MINERDRITEHDFDNVRVTEENFHEAIYKPYEPSPYFSQPEIYVGQEAPRKELVKIITQSPPGTVAIISEDFGLGKTALMHSVIHELVDNEHVKPSEIHHAFAIGQSLRTEAFFREGASDIAKVCFVEELDRHRPDRESLENQLIQADRLLDQTPVVVLIGDRSLRNPSIARLVNSPREPIYVPLNPLTSDLLRKIIHARLISYFARQTIGDLQGYFYRAVFSRLKKEGRQALDNLGNVVDKKIGEIESRISPDEINRIFDPEFLAHFIPNTEPPIANTRYALYALAMLAKNLQSPNKTIRISGELLTKKVPETDWRHQWQVDSYTGEKREFIIWLHDYIRHNYDGSAPFRALSVDELIQRCPLGISTAEEYEEKILRPLSEVNVLAPTGIPFLNDGHQIQEPYLPYQQTFLEAKYGPIPVHAQPKLFRF